MKPTKETRNNIYTATLRKIRKKTDYMCIAMLYAMDMCDDYYEITEDNFPEMFAYNPMHETLLGGWFPMTTKGMKKRIEILKNCIEQTKP